MEQIQTLLLTSAGTIVVIAIVNIIFMWLFLRSAIKSGVIAALETVLQNMEIEEEEITEIPEK